MDSLEIKFLEDTENHDKKLEYFFLKEHLYKAFEGDNWCIIKQKMNLKKQYVIIYTKL